MPSGFERLQSEWKKSSVLPERKMQYNYGVYEPLLHFRCKFLFSFILCSVKSLFCSYCLLSLYSVQNSLFFDQVLTATFEYATFSRFWSTARPNDSDLFQNQAGWKIHHRPSLWTLRFESSGWWSCSDSIQSLHSTNTNGYKSFYQC